MHVLLYIAAVLSFALGFWMSLQGTDALLLFLITVVSLSGAAAVTVLKDIQVAVWKLVVNAEKGERSIE